MGLTIHYKLRWTPTGPPPHDDSVLRFVEEARKQIIRARLGRVSRIVPASAEPWTRRQIDPRRERIDKTTHIVHFAELRPEGGSVFTLDVGADCEPATMGLCHYPARVWQHGRDWPTGLTGWRLDLFS